MWDLWAVQVEEGKPAGAPFMLKPDFGDPYKRLSANGRIIALGGGYSMDDVFYLDVHPSDAKRIGRLNRISNTDSGNQSSPSWSPDGKRIAFVVKNRTDLCVRSLTDNTEKIYSTGMKRIRFALWSPSGDSIALVENIGKPTFLYHLDTEELLPLPAEFPPEETRTPVGWSQDGRQLIFRTGSPQLFADATYVAYDVESGERQVFAPPDIMDVQGFFSESPDRTRTAVVMENRKKLLILDHATGEQTLLKTLDPNDKSLIISPSWAPNGQMVSFIIVPEEMLKTRTHIAAADGSWEKTLEFGTNFQSVQWSPDSQRIVLVKTEQGAEITLFGNFQERLNEAAAQAPAPEIGSSNQRADTVSMLPGALDLVYEEQSNFHMVSSGVWRSDQPTEKTIRILKQFGLKTVVNFRNKNEPNAEDFKFEEPLTKELGIQYYNFPLQADEEQNPETFREIMKVISNPENQPLLIHCSSGRNRTGIVTALFRVLHQNESVENARRELYLMGFDRNRWPSLKLIEDVFDQLTSKTQ